MRGRERSRAPEEIIEEIKKQVADGVIEEMGTPEEVFENPKSEKTRAFISGTQGAY